jgi:hypothetical protein
MHCVEDRFPCFGYKKLCWGPPSLLCIGYEGFSSQKVKANSHILCRSHAVPMPFPCRSPAALIHTCHAAPLPFSDSAVLFVKVCVVDRNIRTASLLLVTTFVEFHVVVGRSRSRAGRPHAVSGRPMLIHTYHAVPMLPHAALCRGLEKSFSERHGRGMAWKRHGRSRHV